MYAKRPLPVPEMVFGFVTTTFTVPGPRAGVLAVSEVELPKTTLAAGTPPSVTVAPFTKPEPVMVTVVPPVTGPVVGEIAVTVGGTA